MEILKMVEQYKLYQNYSNLQISDFWKDVLDLLVSYSEFSNSEFEQLLKVRDEIKKLFKQNRFEHIEYLRPH